MHSVTLSISRFAHPEVGEIELKCQHFTVPVSPGQRLVVWQPDPDSAGQEALDFLRDGRSMPKDVS